MKSNIIAIIVIILIIGGAILFTKNNNPSSNQTNINNVSLINGKQIIEINVKGGYSPRVSFAKANIPTIIRFKTNGTFDCSASIRIPSMNVSQILPNSGATDVDLGISKTGLLQGMCGMGMYPFEINFK